MGHGQKNANRALGIADNKASLARFDKKTSDLFKEQAVVNKQASVKMTALGDRLEELEEFQEQASSVIGYLYSRTPKVRWMLFADRVGKIRTKIKNRLTRKEVADAETEAPADDTAGNEASAGEIESQEGRIDLAGGEEQP